MKNPHAWLIDDPIARTSSDGGTVKLSARATRAFKTNSA
jgi:hypothetical protein